MTTIFGNPPRNQWNEIVWHTETTHGLADKIARLVAAAGCSLSADDIRDAAERAIDLLALDPPIPMSSP